MPGIDELIKSLNSASEKERAFAAEDLGYENSDESVSALVERLQVEDSRFVREVIVNALKSMDTPLLINTVVSLLYSDDAFTRNSAIDILARLGDKAVDGIRPLLADPSKDVRKFVLDIAFHIGGAEAKAVLAEALSDPEVNNVITAVEYLGRLESTEYTDRINELFRSTGNLLLRCTCLEALARIGDETSQEIVTRLYPDYESIGELEKYSYLKFIAGKGTRDHLPLLLSFMREKGPLMVKEIINALEGILQRNGYDLLPSELLSEIVHFIGSPINDINRYELLVLLGEYKNPEIYSLFLRYLQPENKLACLGAVEGLGLYGNRDAVTYLNNLRQHTHDDELLEAIERSLELLRGRGGDCWAD